MEKKKSKYQNRPPAKGSVVIQYIQGVSETVARVFQSKGICTHYKPSTLSVSNWWLQKTGLRRNRNRVLYTKSCVMIAPLLIIYVGESERALKTCLAGHRRPSGSSSHIVQDTKNTKHSINWNNVKVLDQLVKPRSLGRYQHLPPTWETAAKL